MKLQSHKGILEAAAQILDTILKDEKTQKKLMGLGLPEQQVQKGINLRDHALSMQDAQETCQDEKWEISQQVNEDSEQAIKLFKMHVKIARIAFRNDPVLLRQLKIKRFASGKWDIVDQADHFYTTLYYRSHDMASFGITKEVLGQTKAAIEAVKSSKWERTRKKGMAQVSTKQKQKAFKELKMWVVEFRTIARFAFRNNPQLLETFGIVVPSTPKSTKAVKN
jgi:hypothetical protein